MPLEPGIGEVVEQPGGDVLFPMNDGPRRIRCKVAAVALYELTGGKYRTPKRAFQSVRLHVEGIASAKYDQGLFEANGTITVGPRDLSEAIE